MPVVLYQMPASGPCRAVRMAAKELNVDLELRHVDLMKGDQLKPEYLQMNPQHTVPTLDDNGFYLWESRAIMTYLANKYAPDSELYPKDHQKRAVVDRLLYFDIGTLYKAQSDYMYPQLFKGQPADPEKEETFKTALGFLDGFLAKTRYVAADHLTLADLSILASLTFAELMDYDFSGYPHVTAWLERLKAELPYYKEINEDSLAAFKQWIQQKKSQQ